MVFVNFLCIALFPAITAGLVNSFSNYKPPNQVVSAELVCTDRDLQLHVLLEKPLNHPARVYVKEQSANPHCVHRYETNADHNALMFRVPLSACGMQRIQYHSSKFSFTTSIVVSFHRFFVSSYDRSFRVTCDYAQLQQPPKQDVTVGVGVEEAEDVVVSDVYPETADCSYNLYHRKNSTKMEKAKTVQIGDELEHVWTCQNLHQNQFIFVHDCVVNPEFSLGDDPVIIDSRGCLADDTGIGPIEYSSDGKTAVSRHLAYKFEKYPNLLFTCQLTVCTTSSQNCRFSDGTVVTLPLNCSQNRQTRSITPLGNNSIELSEMVQVEDVLISASLNREDPRSQALPLCSHVLILEAGLCTVSLVLFCLSLLLYCKRNSVAKIQNCAS